MKDSLKRQVKDWREMCWQEKVIWVPPLIGAIGGAAWTVEAMISHSAYYGDGILVTIAGIVIGVPMFGMMGFMLGGFVSLFVEVPFERTICEFNENRKREEYRQVEELAVAGIYAGGATPGASTEEIAQRLVIREADVRKHYAEWRARKDIEEMNQIQADA